MLDTKSYPRFLPPGQAFNGYGVEADKGGAFGRWARLEYEDAFGLGDSREPSGRGAVFKNFLSQFHPGGMPEVRPRRRTALLRRVLPACYLRPHALVDRHSLRCPTRVFFVALMAVLPADVPQRLPGGLRGVRHPPAG